MVGVIETGAGITVVAGELLLVVGGGGRSLSAVGIEFADRTHSVGYYRSQIHFVACTGGVVSACRDQLASEIRPGGGQSEVDDGTAGRNLVRC